MPAKFKRRTTPEILADMALPVPRGAAKPTYDDKTGQVLKYYNDTFVALASLPPEASAYPLLRKPQRGDWLEEHTEAGQPLRSFFRGQFKAQPHGQFNEIALVILGSGFPKSIIEPLRQYVAAFYQLNVTVHGPLGVEKTDPKIRTCINEYTRKRQLFASDAMHFAQKYIQSDRSRSRNTIAFMGITMEDLTKDESWNFLYGLASLCDGCGVFSMARFSPAFNDEPCSSKEEEEAIIFKRCCKVVTHELGHIFGLKHCVHFGCLMNGVNHVGELNHQELLECPSCTQKLQSSFWWDLEARFTGLANAMGTFGFDQEADKVAGIIIPTIKSTAKSSEMPAAVKSKYKM